MNGKKAIMDEFSPLLRNNTWEMTNKIENQKVISCKTVLTNKLNSNGTLNRRKARIVARGCNQTYGVDYNEIFSPVARLSTLRLMIAVSVVRNMEIHQLDVESACLNGEYTNGVAREVR